MKKLIAMIVVLSLACTAACAAALDGWTEDSPALETIAALVAAATDENSESYLPPRARVAVFDFDGTLYGELFPTYFDVMLFVHRALEDEDCHPDEDVRAHAEALLDAAVTGKPEPDFERSTAQCAAELFAGMTPEEYRAYIRAFAETPVIGFENMTYSQGFYQPMLSLIEFLSDNGFQVYISSGSERTIVRVMTEGVLDDLIPPDRVIGSDFSYVATGQGDTAGRSYTYQPDDQVILGGDLLMKNLKMNKVSTIIGEIGADPYLVFGNSSGDFAMAQYALQKGGYAFMLLADDEDRDYGDAAEAGAFREKCLSYGFYTVSMRDEFETIYYGDAVKTALEPAA